MRKYRQLNLKKYYILVLIHTKRLGHMANLETNGSKDNIETKAMHNKNSFFRLSWKLVLGHFGMV
jgi:hypothetical protein